MFSKEEKNFENPKVEVMIDQSRNLSNTMNRIRPEDISISLNPNV